jgi:predicted small secreted protein
MKKTIKVLGITALVAVIGFAFAACSNSTGGGDDHDVMGATLRLYNKPVTVDPSASACTATNFGYYYDHGEKQPLGNAISGTPTATIAGGMSKTLTVSLDAPKPAALVLIAENFLSPGFTVTPSDAKYWSVRDFWESTQFYYLELTSGGSGYAELFYVDKDVTITVHGFAPQTVTLQAGWNYWLSDGPTATRTLPNGYNWTLYAD